MWDHVTQNKAALLKGPLSLLSLLQPSGKNKGNSSVEHKFHSSQANIFGHNSGSLLLGFLFRGWACLWDFSFPTRDQTWTLDSESKVLTAGLPGNSLVVFFFFFKLKYS